MNRKTYINREAVEVKGSRVKASDLLKLAGRDPDKYELQLRRGEEGPVAKTYGRDEIVDLDSECGGGKPGSPSEDGHTPTNAGGGGATTAAPGDPGGESGGGGAPPGASEGQPGNGAVASATDDKQGCYFTTRYTGPINPA